MNRTGRALTSGLLVAVGVGGVVYGLTSQSATSTTSSYLTDTVTSSTVQKSISDSGTVVDQYTYSIAPGTDPVLTERAGSEVGSASRASGYTVEDLRVSEGQSVKKGDVLAVVTNDDDDDSDVEAPFDGRIRSLATAEGAAAPVVATLGVGRRDVAVTVSEYDVARLRIDQNADLRLDASGATFDGTVAAISQTAETTSGVQTYQVTIRTTDLPSSARPGMTVTATIALTSKAGVLSVPLTAVTGSGGDATVQVLDGEGEAVTRGVTIGLVGDTRVEITKGLEAGEKVVTGVPGGPAVAVAPVTPGPPPGAPRPGS